MLCKSSTTTPDTYKHHEAICLAVRGLCVVYGVEDVWLVPGDAVPVHEMLSKYASCIRRALFLKGGESGEGEGGGVGVGTPEPREGSCPRLE